MCVQMESLYCKVNTDYSSHFPQNRDPIGESDKFKQHEAIYSLGQHQNENLNYRGYKVVLAQTRKDDKSNSVGMKKNRGEEKYYSSLNYSCNRKLIPDVIFEFKCKKLRSMGGKRMHGIAFRL